MSTIETFIERQGRSRDVPVSTLCPATSLCTKYLEQTFAELKINRLLPFAVIALEFALVVGAVCISNVDTDFFELVLKLALGGFVVHHFLPMAWRQPFFGLLSMASVLLVFGGVQGPWLLGLGGLLIALCHVPLAFWARVAIVFAVACALALSRVKALPSLGDSGIPATVWPILGSMFMFRLLVYLYDVTYRAATFSPSKAVGYFFMLPNVCFPLFPIVDYKTFQRCWYREDALQTYQTGVKWMVRGLVQLMLYRWVYLRGVIEPSEVVTGFDAAQYIFMTYLLYLKISGSFHFIVGLLHMFGYSLPETHHLYLLSSSFTDFWRRINIYWKDFIQKLIFNPSYSALRRRLGHERALVLATAIAFVATWFFHSYQWFWIRGSFPIVWNDLVFWSSLALIVLVNVIAESRMGRQRSLKTPSRTLNGDAILALKTAGTFSSICLLWTIWSTPSLTELQIVVKALLNSRPLDVVLMATVPLGVGVVAVLQAGRKPATEFGMPKPIRRTVRLCTEAIGVCVLMVAMIIVSWQPTLLLPVSYRLSMLARDISERKLNEADKSRSQLGYYESLSDTKRLSDEFGWRIFRTEPQDWVRRPVLRAVSGTFPYEHYEASSRYIYNGVVESINSRGMKDREYTIQLPERTFRIGLVGASNDAGWHVRVDETYENVVEDRLNRELAPVVGTRFEILNFSRWGYDPVEKLAMIEHTVLKYQPHVIIYVANNREARWMFRTVPRLVGNGDITKYPFLTKAMERANVIIGAEQKPPELSWLRPELVPYAEEALLAILKRVRLQCDSRGIRPVLAVLPTLDNGKVRPKVLQVALYLGRDAGLSVIDLFGDISEVEDMDSLQVAPWDPHFNPAGHRLVADRLYQQLLEQKIVPTTPIAGPEIAGEADSRTSNLGN